MKYCETIKKKIISLQADRKFYLNRIKEVKAMNDDVILSQELVADANIYLDNEINIDWAVKSIGEVKEVLKAFAQKGVMLEAFHEDETSPIWYLRRKDGEHRFRLRPVWYRDGEQVEGATCKLVQVGVTVTEYPKYKLICSDGSSPEKV